MTLRNHIHFSVIALLAIGCGQKSAPNQASESTPAPGHETKNSAPPSTPKARVSDRPGNTKGDVFIVEYHHIKTGKGTMFRTTDEFRGDLERFNKLGFRPCTVSQYLSGSMDLPPGASPMVFTFDDSNPSQFQLLPDGSVDPTCAIGIWQAFAKEHPDFPVKATFYVLPKVMWTQKGLGMKKVEMLRAMGCELGNHTVTHGSLKKMTDEQVKHELGEASDHLVALGETMPPSLALPFGISPKNRELTHGFSYNGKTYAFKACLLVGANPAPATTSKKFDAFRLPRIQACAGPYGIDYWLDLLEKKRVKVYVQP
jgi:hypothetical protein